MPRVLLVCLVLLSPVRPHARVLKGSGVTLGLLPTRQYAVEEVKYLIFTN